MRSGPYRDSQAGAADLLPGARSDAEASSFAYIPGYEVGASYNSKLR